MIRERKKRLLAVKSPADIFGVHLHFTPEERKNVPPATHRKLPEGGPYGIRRNVRRNDDVLDILTRVVVFDSERLQYNRVLQKRRYAIGYGDILLQTRNYGKEKKKEVRIKVMSGGI